MTRLTILKLLLAKSASYPTTGLVTRYPVADREKLAVTK